MAKSGTSSSVVDRDSSRSSGTRAKLIDAAIETLKAEGYAGSSARAIAERAGLNQGLIFYHFGSVANLLLAALDSVSARRMAQYGAAVDAVRTPSELVDVATAIFREDLDAGYVAVLVEMIAGASSTPGLGRRGVRPPRTLVRLRRAGGDHDARARRSTRSCHQATWRTPSWPSTSGSRC